MRKQRKHNPIAAALAKTVFRAKVVKSKKLYNRKKVKKDQK
jgi:stalled ribosome alternative rescue factor ArfA